MARDRRLQRDPALHRLISPLDSLATSPTPIPHPVPVFRPLAFLALFLTLVPLASAQTAADFDAPFAALDLSETETATTAPNSARSVR